MFILNDTLKKDLIFIKDLNLCSLFILPDSDIPWIVLVPRINNITEIHELDDENSLILINEIKSISKSIETHFNVDKVNIGALGNMVPQLHVHIIGRYKNDRAWPKAIWGTKSSGTSDKMSSRLIDIFS